MALVDEIAARYRARLLKLEARAATQARRDAAALLDLVQRRAERAFASSAVSDAYQAIAERGLTRRELDRMLSNVAEYRRLVQAAAEYHDGYARAAVRAIDEARAEILTLSQQVALASTVTQVAPEVVPQVAGMLRLVPVEQVARLVSLAAADSPIWNLASLDADTSGVVMRQMIDGAARGMGPREVARRVSQQIEHDADWQVLRVTRTEMLRSSRAVGDEWMRANVDVLAEWVWHAKLDGATCAACWAMHGTTHEVGEAMGTHPNCRCAQVPRPKSPAELGFDGIADDRPQFESGEDLFARLDPATQAQILGPSKHAAYQAGEIRLGDVVRRSESKDWGVSRGVGSLEHARSVASARTPKSRRQASSTISARTSTKQTQTPKPTPDKRQGVRIKSSPKSSPSLEKFERGVSIVNDLHAPNIEISFNGSARVGSAYGKYFLGSRSVSIKLREGAERTTVHELGHAIDHQIFGGGFTLGSQVAAGSANHPMRAWWETVQATAYRDRIDAAYPSRKGAGARKYAKYLKTPEEVWARSYEQWVALRSGNPIIASASNYGGAKYWPEDEFAAIAAEMDRLLR